MKNTKAGLCLLICGAALMMGGAQARMPTVPREMGAYTTIPNSEHHVLLAGRSDEFQPGGLLQEYSVYSQNEATVRHLHGALLQAMANSGYQPGWKQMVDGQGIETWYHWGLDQTVMSVRWSTETGYVQSTYQQTGRLKAGEIRGTDAPGDLVPTVTLEDALQAFAVTSGNAGSVASAEKISHYQQRHQDLLAFLGQRGFRPTWLRESESRSQGTVYAAWYHPDLNVTVVCMTWPDGDGQAQTIMSSPGRLQSNVFFPQV